MAFIAILCSHVTLKRIRVCICNTWRAHLYSGKSLNEGRPTTQNPTVLGVRIKRRSLGPLLLRPEYSRRRNNERLKVKTKREQ